MDLVPVKLHGTHDTERSTIKNILVERKWEGAGMNTKKKDIRSSCNTNRKIRVEGQGRTNLVRNIQGERILQKI